MYGRVFREENQVFTDGANYFFWCSDKAWSPDVWAVDKPSKSSLSRLRSPSENVDITTSETLKLTVRLRIWTGNRLDVSTTGKEKATGWKWLALMELTDYKNILDKNVQRWIKAFTKMFYIQPLITPRGVLSWLHTAYFHMSIYTLFIVSGY